MIPFPAVSICSSVKFTKDKIDVGKFNDALGDTEQSAILSLSPEEYVKVIFNFDRLYSVGTIFYTYIE